MAVAAAWASVRVLPDAPPIMHVAIADVIATVVIFAFSRAFDNSSFYDAYWTIAPMVIAPYLAFGPYATEGISVRKWLALAVVLVWGGRLTWNWVRGWQGLAHEDWRYVHFRPKWGRRYWAGSFLAFHFMPTVCTFLGCLPLFVIMSSPRPLRLLDLAGVGVALGGAIVEAVADAQLRNFRADCTTQGRSGGICEAGLWRYSRHPNYFGECTFWVGLWLLGAAAAPADAVWTSAGAVVIIALFVFGTIPMMERRSIERRPAFADHQRKVSMLVPWFRSS